MGIERRLPKLERSAELRAPKAPCPKCGLQPGSTGVYRHLRVAFPDQPSGPSHCSGCRRQLVFTIEFDQAG